MNLWRKRGTYLQKVQKRCSLKLQVLGISLFYLAVKHFGIILAGSIVNYPGAEKALRPTDSQFPEENHNLYYEANLNLLRCSVLSALLTKHYQRLCTVVDLLLKVSFKQRLLRSVARQALILESQGTPLACCDHLFFYTQCKFI